VADLPRVNLHALVPTYDESDPEGYRAGMARFGPAIGASQMGASLYELPPGQSICPYHYEYPEEEWLVVRRVFDAPAAYDELREWLAGQWRSDQGARTPEASRIFDELGLVAGARRQLLESESFRVLLAGADVELPLPQAA